MKKILIIILCSIAFHSFGQGFLIPPLAIDSTQISSPPDMLVYDRLGNSYFLNQLKFLKQSIGNNSATSIPPTCIAGIFRLHYDDAGTGLGFDDPILGPQRQVVACQVYTDLSQLIVAANSPYTSIPNLGNGSYVEIWVQSSLNSASNPTLGTAGQFFLTSSPGILHGSVWQTINTGIDSWFGVNATNFGSYGIYHGVMQINFGHPFYLGSNPALIPSTDYDLYTVILHEATHALGFGSLINSNGLSKFAPVAVYSYYDTYLKDNATGTNLLNWNGCYSANFNASYLSDLTTPCAVKFAGTNTTFVTANTTWSGGTSLSHYNTGSCGNSGTYVMNPSLSASTTERFYDIAEVTTLCDLGYKTSGVLASTTYPSNGVCGYRVAGTNDYATYTSAAPGTNFSTQNNTPYTFSSTDILSNDQNALYYDCLEVVNASGNITGSLSGGIGNNIVFTPNTGFQGVAILKYIPRASSTGQRGNITYIFILVLPPALLACNPTQCEMVCYGGFEEFTSQLQYDLYTLGSFSTGNSFSFYPPPFPDNSPDFKTTVSGTSWTCGGTYSGGVTAHTGSNYIGMVLRSDPAANNMGEGPCMPLNQPLLPGETATIDFWARKSDVSCDAQIQVRFTDIQPCMGNTFLGICPGLTQTPAVPASSGLFAANTQWQHFNVVITNPLTGVPLNYLLLNSFTTTPHWITPVNNLGYVYLDDIHCTKNTPNLTITKTGPATACPNDILSYTINVCNTSAFPANAVQIMDVLSSGLTIASGGTFNYPAQNIPVLAPGGCQNYTLNAMVNVSTGSVTNTANVSSGGCLSNTNTNSVITTITQPALNITQIVSNLNPVSGSIINLTVDVCNYTGNTVNGINIETSVPLGNIISPGVGYTISAGNVITFNTFNLGAGTITTPSCSTFVIPITVYCSGNGSICSTILSGGIICTSQNICSTISVVPPPIVYVSYTGTPYCQTATNPLPTLTSGAVGTFSASPIGLVFISTSTGQIDLSASSVGTYTVTYTVTASNGCPTTTTSTIVTIINCIPSCSNCPNTLPSSLTSSPLGFQVYCVNSPVTVTGAVSIVLSELKIAPGMTITITPGSTLTISGSHLYSCTDMWQGIIVKPGGSLVVQNFSIFLPPFININRSSMIEDAQVAIDVLGGSTLTSNLLTINNTTFNKNRIGIRINNYTPALTTYPFSIVSSVFTSRVIAFTPGSFNWPNTNTIKALTAVTNPLQTPYINDVTYPDSPVNAYLKPPYAPGASKPIAGIVLSRVGQTINASAIPTYYEIKIGTPGVPNNNVFDNLAVCIDATNTNFTCVNNVFQRTVAGQKVTAAINAVANEIYNCRLQVIPAAATNFVNRFYDCGISINASNYFEVTAKYCDVRSLQNISQMGLQHRGQNGFIVNTNRYIAIYLSNNTLTNIENAISFNSNIGLYSVGPWYSPSGQYSGQVDINQNTIQAYLPGNPFAGTYVDKAITASNVTGTTHFINTTQTVNTNNNQIINVFKGIRCNNWQKKSVITNTNTISLVDLPTTAPQYGISHANNIPLNPMSNLIESNIVTGYGILDPAVAGIATQLCNNQIVKCNTTRNITMGIYFAGNEMPTIFKYNRFDNTGTNRHKYAFVLNNNGFIGQQGAAGSPSDNTWIPASNWTSGVHFKTATLNGSFAWDGIVGSPLWVRTSPTTYNPSGTGYNTTTGAAGIVDYNFAGAINTTLPSGPTPLPCPVIPHSPILSPGLILSMEKIAKDQIVYTVNNEATKIIGKNQLYRLLKNDPSYMSTSTDLQNFYLQSQTMYREDFSSIEENLVTADFSLAQSKVAALAPASTIENNYKDFYNLYIKQQTDSLINQDSTLLYTIANACPFTDGAIVYQARAMYNAVYDVNKDFEDHCVNVENRSAIISKETEPSFDADLFPNPTTGEVFINPKGLANETMEIRVKDVNGKIVYTQYLQLSNEMSNFKLDICNGVYIVHITNTKTHETIIKKLVIQK